MQQVSTFIYNCANNVHLFLILASESDKILTRGDEMKERIIMHSDINHCFAQIEEMMFPELKEVPMAVGGSESKRSGII